MLILNVTGRCVDAVGRPAGARSSAGEWPSSAGCWLAATAARKVSAPPAGSSTPCTHLSRHTPHVTYFTREQHIIAGTPVLLHDLACVDLIAGLTQRLCGFCCNSSCPVWCHCSYQSSGLPSAAAMQQEYSQTARALCADVDVFLAETLSTVAEAEAALQATAQLGEASAVVLFVLVHSSNRLC